MITAHHEDHLTLWDGEREHAVAHADFAHMRVGGIHPAITEERQTWLHVPEGADLTGCPVAPVRVTVEDRMVPGGEATHTYLPVKAWLQAVYGPDGRIVSVPINGDAAAQRLHWLKRTAEEREEMRALLTWMGIWRLTDDGEMPQ